MRRIFSVVLLALLVVFGVSTFSQCKTLANASEYSQMVEQFSTKIEKKRKGFFGRWRERLKNRKSKKLRKKVIALEKKVREQAEEFKQRILVKISDLSAKYEEAVAVIANDGAKKDALIKLVTKEMRTESLLFPLMTYSKRLQYHIAYLCHVLGVTYFSDTRLGTNLKSLKVYITGTNLLVKLLDLRATLLKSNQLCNENWDSFWIQLEQMQEQDLFSKIVK